MTPHALLFTLAAMGISETAYLIRKRMALEAPVCPIGEDCATVLSSKYSKIFGIHNEYLGLLFYFAVSFAAAFLVIGVGSLPFWNFILRVLVAGASVFSAFLIYLQWRVIQAWCFWCVMSAITVFIMALILLTNDLIIF